NKQESCQPSLNPPSSLFLTSHVLLLPSTATITGLGRTEEIFIETRPCGTSASTTFPLQITPSPPQILVPKRRGQAGVDGDQTRAATAVILQTTAAVLYN
ncbi:hypothetical protein OTU49_012890, partial [Cherax quadricarinatus]